MNLLVNKNVLNYLSFRLNKIKFSTHQPLLSKSCSNCEDDKSKGANSMFFPVAKSSFVGDKVSIIGAGMCGSTICACFLAKGISSNIVLIDKNENLAIAESNDIQHGWLLGSNTVITAGKDFNLIKDSRLVIVTAGTRGELDSTGASLFKSNAKVYEEIIPKIVKQCPDAVLLVITNPSDLMAGLAWKLSGFPPNRVLGIGTGIMSSQFSYMLSKKFGVAHDNVHCNIIGGNWFSCTPIWSCCNIAGVRLQCLNEHIGTDKDPEKLYDLFCSARKSDLEIIRLKGNSCFGIAFNVCGISSAILRNSNFVHIASTLPYGTYGLTKNVYVSLPCKIAGTGVTEILHHGLTEAEDCTLRKAVDEMDEVQRNYKKS